MHGITSCKNFQKGDIYSWDASDWESYDKDLQKNEVTAVQYRQDDVSKKSLCETVQKYIFFPDNYGFKIALNLCRRFGGRLVDVSTSEKSNAVAIFLGKNITENPKYDEALNVRTSTTYSDVKELNAWVDFLTGNPPKDPLAWGPTEPNSGMVENRCTLN